MTTNVEITGHSATKLTGLTDDKTYYIQALYEGFGGTIMKNEIELIASSTAPADDLHGLRGCEFKKIKQTGIDLYVRNLSDKSLIVIEEC